MISKQYLTLAPFDTRHNLILSESPGLWIYQPKLLLKAWYVRKMPSLVRLVQHLPESTELHIFEYIDLEFVKAPNVPPLVKFYAHRCFVTIIVEAGNCFNKHFGMLGRGAGADAAAIDAPPTLLPGQPCYRQYYSPHE